MCIRDSFKTALASPYIAFPLAYLGIQMLEDIPAASTKTIEHPAIPEQGHWYYYEPVYPKFYTADFVPYTPDPVWVVDKAAVDAWTETVTYPSGFITKELGDAMQALMTLTAAGPMIQGVGTAVGSAFKKGK